VWGFATWPWAFAPRVAWVAASAALYACALMVASTRQRDASSPVGVTIATLV
jgi:hypothetical protein